MATTTTAVERIVRKVLNEEQEETVNAIRELSDILTEQVIPKLSGSPNGETEWNEDDDPDQDEEDQDTIPMSALDAEPSMGRRKKPSPPNGHDESEEEDIDAPEQPDQDVPKAVIDAFTSLYQSMSAEQAAALAELFTTIDSALDDQGADESEGEEEENEQEESVHA